MYYTNFAALAAILSTCLTLTTPVLSHDHPNQQKNKSSQAHGNGNGHGNGKNKGGGHKHYEFRIETSFRLSEFWVPSADKQVQNVLNLARKPGARPHNAAYLQALRGGHQVDGVYGVEEVDVTDTGLVFATEVEIGDKKYELVVDTGSSDTWVPKSNFQCVAVGTGDVRPQADCGLASTYTPSPSYKALQNLNYYVQYTDGENLRGTFATEKVTVADITVRDQQIALVDTAAWIGDGATSGLLGLAFPAATKSYRGSNYLENSPANQVLYNPIFTNMYKKGHVAPLFSIALDRDVGGQLAIGGLPPVPHFPLFASSPFQLLTTASPNQVGTSSSSAYTLYTITTNGFDYSNASSSQWSYANFPNPFARPSDRTQVQVIIDTATVLMYLPPATADAVNSLFTPPPKYKTNAGLYVLDCKATAPRFGVKIGFETFFVEGEDMVVEIGGQCVSGVAATGEGGTSILGAAFLKNVLAVFDVGAQMMRFAQRQY